MRNSHCQPWRPRSPSSFSSASDSGRADDHRDRGGHHEERAGPGAVRGRDPVGQVEDHPREEAGFGDARGARATAMNDRTSVMNIVAHRDETPADHDAGDPAAGADAFQDEVARDLEQAVAEEEEPRAKPEFGGAQAQVALQLGRREADIHAVDIGDDVADEGEGDEAAPDSLQDLQSIWSGLRTQGSRLRQDRRSTTQDSSCAPSLEPRAPEPESRTPNPEPRTSNQSLTSRPASGSLRRGPTNSRSGLDESASDDCREEL